jgi:hypothetical protein
LERFDVPVIFKEDVDNVPTFAVPLTFIDARDPSTRPVIFALLVTLRVLNTPREASRVPDNFMSDGKANRSKESFAILSYTYAEFLSESDMCPGITW